MTYTLREGKGPFPAVMTAVSPLLPELSEAGRMGGLAPHPPEGLVSVGGDSDGRMSQSMRVLFSVRINVATARGGEEEQQTRASGASAPSERVKPVWRAGMVVTRERGPACVSRTSGDRLRKAACSMVKTWEFIRTTKNPLEGFKEGRGGPDPSPDRSHGRGESPGLGHVGLQAPPCLSRLKLSSKAKDAILGLFVYSRAAAENISCLAS